MTLKRLIKSVYKNFGWKWWIYTVVFLLLATPRGTQRPSLSYYLTAFFAFVLLPWFIIFMINKSTDFTLRKIGRTDSEGNLRRPRVNLWLYTISILSIVSFTEPPTGFSQVEYFLMGLGVLVLLPWSFIGLQKLIKRKVKNKEIS